MKKPDAQKNGLRILIVRISAIGDVLHVTSVVHNLRRLLPDAEITWLASPPASLLRDDCRAPRRLASPSVRLRHRIRVSELSTVGKKR